MNLKIVLWIIIFVIFNIPVNALVISEVLYNPIGSENDLEFVELYNNENLTINLTGAIVSTASYKMDAVLPEVFILPHHYYLIADKGYNEAKNDSWAEADYEEDITLTNSRGFVEIIKDNKTLCRVSWNTTKEGYSLNNGRFFSKPNPRNSESYSDYITFSVNITRPEINITSVVMPDESPEKGIQIYPFPGETRRIPLHVNVSGKPIAVKVEFNGGIIYKETSVNNTYVFYLSIPYDLKPGDYRIQISAGNCYKNISFELKEVKAFEIDVHDIKVNARDNVIVYGDTDISTKDKPTIKNTGNSVVLITVSSPGLFGSSEIFSLYFGRSLEDMHHVFDYRLKVNEAMPLFISFSVPPDVSPDIYSGIIEIDAR